MSGFGIWVVLQKNVEVLYLDKKSPQYEWIWDLGGLATKCRGIIPRQKKSAMNGNDTANTMCDAYPHKVD